MSSHRTTALILSFVCSMVLRSQPAGPQFYKDVLPILQEHCQSCHRPGQIGPMPLVTYEDARAKATSMERMVRLKKMPPWFADSRYGYFSNDPSLTSDQINTISEWV